MYRKRDWNSALTLRNPTWSITVDITTPPARRFQNQRLKSEVPMNDTLFTPKIAETVLKEKAKKPISIKRIPKNCKRSENLKTWLYGYHQAWRKDRSWDKNGEKDFLYRTIHIVHMMLKWMANSLEETVDALSQQGRWRSRRRHNLPKSWCQSLCSRNQKVLFEFFS